MSHLPYFLPAPDMGALATDLRAMSAAGTAKLEFAIGRDCTRAGDNAAAAQRFDLAADASAYLAHLAKERQLGTETQWTTCAATCRACARRARADARTPELGAVS